jgi:hypothetical protein
MRSVIAPILSASGARHTARAGRTLTAMGFGTTLVAVVALVVGLPLAIVGLAAAGLVGWIVAAIVLPLATLAVILWLGRPRPGDGEPPV